MNPFRIFGKRDEYPTEKKDESWLDGADAPLKVMGCVFALFAVIVAVVIAFEVHPERGWENPAANAWIRELFHEEPKSVVCNLEHKNLECEHARCAAVTQNMQVVSFSCEWFPTGARCFLAPGSQK